MTGITSITRDWGDNVAIVRIITTDNLATATGAGYITAQEANIELANNGAFQWLASDMCLVYASDGWVFASISADFTRLNALVFSTTVVGAPVVVGDFAVFASTGGNIKDSGFLPSNPAKTAVVMANGAVTSGNIAVFTDTAGTIGSPANGTIGILSVNDLLYGATPVAQVDPASCTIVAAAGAANTSTVTIQLKDGAGTNMARIIPFKVYASSASNGLTLASAASTGFSVASGGLSLNNGAAITTQISAMSSETGGCVLSLLDTAKQTSYLVLVLSNGTKISAQLSAGSYG